MQGTSSGKRGQVPPELDISVAYLRYGIYAFVKCRLVVVVVPSLCSAGDNTLTIAKHQKAQVINTAYTE